MSQWTISIYIVFVHFTVCVYLVRVCVGLKGCVSLAESVSELCTRIVGLGRNEWKDSHGTECHLEAGPS